jgi:ABC-type glycerol-3-phosphate transport system permease component
MKRIARIVALIGLCIIVLFPIYWMLNIALTPVGYSRTTTGFLPSDLTFDNFIHLFTERPLGRWILNSTLVALSATTASIVIGTSAGYALSRLKFRGRNVLLIVILATQMMPQTSIIIPLYALFRDLGLLNSLPGISLSHVTMILPLTIWMTRGFFESLPRELEDAARVDGCSRLRAFTAVALRLAGPGIAAVFVYGFIQSWHEFAYARTLAASSATWTAAVGLASFRGEFFTLFEPQMAASVVFALPVVIMFLILQRQMVSGATAGALRG